MPLTPVNAGSGRAKSINIGMDTLINLVYESAVQQGEAKRAALYLRPGLRPWQVSGDGPTRGNFQQDGRGFAVQGSTLYELDLINNGVTSRGSIANDGLPVFFALNNAQQLGIQGGGKFYVFNMTTNTLSSAVTLPMVNNPVGLVYFDTYFIMIESGTTKFWFSGQDDGLSWSALDLVVRSQTSDNNIGLVMLHNRLAVYGSQTSAMIYDSGDSLNPFVPYPGTVTQEGLMSPYALQVLGESSYWLSQDNQGQRRMVKAQDYAPQRISTAAVDAALLAYPTVADVESFAFELSGHAIVGWVFPSGGDAGECWCYDETESNLQGAPIWFQWMHWDAVHSRYDRPRHRGLCSSNNGLIVGDYQNNCLYYLEFTTYTDNGDIIHWDRIAPYLSAENQVLFIDQIEQGIEAGVGNGTAPDPQIMLSLSRDSGHTFEPPIMAPLGPSGLYNDVDRPAWFQLGSARADRLVAKISGSDPVKTVLGPGLWIRAQAGTNQR